MKTGLSFLCRLCFLSLLEREALERVVLLALGVALGVSVRPLCLRFRCRDGTLLNALRHQVGRNVLKLWLDATCVLQRLVVAKHLQVAWVVLEVRLPAQYHSQSADLELFRIEDFIFDLSLTCGFDGSLRDGPQCIFGSVSQASNRFHLHDEYRTRYCPIP